MNIFYSYLFITSVNMVTKTQGCTKNMCLYKKCPGHPTEFGPKHESCRSSRRLVSGLKTALGFKK